MTLWTAKIYRQNAEIVIPGLDFIPREDEGFLELHYNRAFDKSVAPQYDCGPYVAAFFKDGAQFGQSLQVPNHFWGCVIWVDLDPVSKITRSPAKLIADGIVPPFGDTGLPLDWVKPGTFKFPGPMGLCNGTTGWEPQTGGRWEIGIASAPVAGYLAGKDDARNTLEVAKNVATMPIWNYDESTGKLINLVAKPRVTNYSNQNQGGPPNWLGPHPQQPEGAPAMPSTPDTAHMLDVCGIGALLTGAPRYVRGAQARVIRGFNEDAYWVGAFGEQVTVWNRQVRGTAHLLRGLFYCYWATVYAEEAGNLPADCLPSTIWKKIIDNQVWQFWKFIEPDPYFRKFSALGSHVAWWQHDMLNQVLALYAGKWPEVWGPIYIKFLGNLVARINADGKKQWPVAIPTWYWGKLFAKGASGPFGGGYAELWDYWSKQQAAGVVDDGNTGQLSPAQVAALNADPTNGGTYVNPSEYQSWVFGAIALAVHRDRGVLAGAISKVYPRLEAAYSEQRAMLAKWLANGGYWIAQCSIDVDANPVEPEPGPDPTPEPPDSGEIEMTMPKLGAKFTASVAFFLGDKPTPVEQIVWSASGGARIDSQDGAIANGTYVEEGPFKLKAVGSTGDQSLAVVAEGVVPAPVPFPDRGVITIR